MLWIVKEDNVVYLFKGKVTIEDNDKDGFCYFKDINGDDVDSEFDFCVNDFENVTGIILPNLKPKKLLLTVK